MKQFPPLPDFFAGRVFVLFVDDAEERKVNSNLSGFQLSTYVPLDTGGSKTGHM